MQIDFSFWWSMVSTVVGVILLAVSIWQYWKARNQEEKLKAQVKIWMQDALGLRDALGRIVKDNLDNRFSSTNDVCNAVWSVQAIASAFYQSLYEERCVSEAEYKARQKRFADRAEEQTHKQFFDASSGQTDNGITATK